MLDKLPNIQVIGDVRTIVLVVRNVVPSEVKP
jgi:hypothetical protein